MKRKNVRDCYCVLCSSHRKLRYSRYLSFYHYVQILILGMFVTWILYPWLGFKGSFSLPVIWVAFEGIHKLLYRKDLKCTVCGFDPTWYKKDVKLARRKVEEFLKNNPQSPIFQRARSFEENPFLNLQ